MSDHRTVRVLYRKRVIVDVPEAPAITIRALYLHVGRRVFSLSFDTGRIA